MPSGRDVASLGLPVFSAEAAGSTSSVVPASTLPQSGGGGGDKADPTAKGARLFPFFSWRGPSTRTCETGGEDSQRRIYRHGGTFAGQYGGGAQTSPVGGLEWQQLQQEGDSRLVQLGTVFRHVRCCHDCAVPGEDQTAVGISNNDYQRSQALRRKELAGL